MSKNKTKKNKSEVRKTKIRVVGIGGGGSSIVSEIAPRIKKRNVTFAAANTDAQALKRSSKKCKSFQFGEKLTRGLGTGMDPELGKAAAEKEQSRIKKLFKDRDLSILVSTLGGGVGSGASPVFAKISKDTGTTNLGIFTLPFEFEGPKKKTIANRSLKELKSFLNAFAVIPNQRIFNIVNPSGQEQQQINKKTPLKEALSAINTILADFLENLIYTLYRPGVINIDWADLETVLNGKRKLAYLSSIQKEGPQRVNQAIEAVLNSSLYSYSIQGAERILFNIGGGKDLKISEVEKISKEISDANPRAKIMFGVSQRRGCNNKIKITLLGVGCEQKKSKKRKKTKKKKKKKKEASSQSQQSSSKQTKKKSKSKSGKKKSKQKTKTKKSKKTPNQKKKKSKSKKTKKQKDEPTKKQNKKSKEKKEKPRRNALDLKREAQQAEQRILDREKKWDVPAFLRRKES